MCEHKMYLKIAMAKKKKMQWQLYFPMRGNENKISILGGLW